MCPLPKIQIVEASDKQSGPKSQTWPKGNQNGSQDPRMGPNESYGRSGACGNSPAAKNQRKHIETNACFGSRAGVNFNRGASDSTKKQLTNVSYALPCAGDATLTPAQVLLGKSRRPLWKL